MPNLDNVQAIVARPSARPLCSVLLFRIREPRAAKRFLQEWALQSPGGQSPEPPGDAVFHPMFSWCGLASLLEGAGLGPTAEGQAAFEVFFRDPNQSPGSLAMADQLGFTGASAPAGWWDGFGSADIDLAMLGTFESEAQQTEALARLRAAAADGRAELEIRTFPQQALSGYRPEGGRLHFGFRDGISAPNVDWADAGLHGGVNFRQFILGFPSDDFPTSPLRPGVWQDFAKEGSFACLSWMYQDVAAFNALLSDEAAAVAEAAGAADPQEWLASRVLGRWRDGSPVAVHPNEPPPAADLNDSFSYADDPTGARCPLTAHVRVANSRDQPLSFANTVRFPEGPPRLMRRGFSYGPPLQGAADDGVDRGVVGLFFCARVNEQFYTVLRWMQATEFSDAFAAQPQGFIRQDALTGRRPHPGSNTSLYLDSPGSAPIDVALRDLIRFRGVAVMFAPSLSSLRILAGVQPDRGGDP